MSQKLKSRIITGSIWSDFLAVSSLCTPVYSLLAKNEVAYERRMQLFSRFIDQFLSIRLSPDKNASATDPVWNNGFFPALDAITLYGLISTLKPEYYLEIGSGYSTRIAAKAKSLNSPKTKIISIDPAPRAEIDSLCDEVIREPLERCDLTLFKALRANDILFFDGSHRVLQNSDNEVLFFEIIPCLRSNVYIHLHDIFWPFDYPDEWAQRMYSEQYVLGGMLLYGSDAFEIVAPNVYITYCTDLLKYFQRLWEAPALAGIDKGGASFWLRKKVDG
ncbi:MAG: class I SAM-dependent methyltransferase [Deltaproteobacteria bacterium]|nr:class I SAM-dependent methyltransferase [Deltaproteobacteria bacterium]